LYRDKFGEKLFKYGINCQNPNGVTFQKVTRAKRFKDGFLMHIWLSGIKSLPGAKSLPGISYRK
jgi:hypothetical protein